MGPRFLVFPFGAAKVAKMLLPFFWTVNSSIIVIFRVQTLALERTALLVVIIGDMMI
jgi:hypothetical protein